ncbi:MAG: GNAT family N-acetyltransferase [Salinivirgaceae bacterium]|nr:GNAT family N-acetyltransferase [Salinivirgaceae bacterium]
MNNIFPILHTKRLDLIEIEQKHLPDLFILFSDKKVTEFYNLETFTSEDEAKILLNYFIERNSKQLSLRWGIAQKGTSDLIGTIGFNNYQKNHKANIGYDLQSEYWNQEFISEALPEVIKYGFEKLEINRVEAEIMPGNPASERVLVKNGFKIEGLLRDWMLWNNNHYDMLMYSLLKKDFLIKKN